MTPEGYIEKYLVDRVQATGGRVRKLKWIGRNGAPDRVVWWPYSSPAVIFIELKAPGKKPNDQQKDEIKIMRDDGLLVYVIDSESQIEELIRWQAPDK